MKNFVAKLKGLDYKQLVLEHGEKFVLGVVIVLVLVALGGTKWGRYERMPEEFDQKVNAGTSNLAASKWPDEKRQEVESVKVVSVAVDQLLSEVSVNKFEYATPMDHPIYKKKEKIKEPRWLAVQDLIVDDGRVIIRERPEGPAGGDQTQLADAGNPQPAANPGTAPPGGNGNAPRIQPGAGNNGPVGPVAAGNKGLGPVAGQGPVGLGGGGEMTELSDTAQVNARGLRYIAVRGVFPMKEQTDQLARAMNESVPARAGQLIEFLDFVLERQTAVAGPDPWSGKWEKVDMQVALDILRKVDDFDIDKVDTSLTDAVFTAPLPLRVAGFWGSHATHPRIKTLTAEQAEQQALLIQKVVEAQQNADSAQGAAKGGFAARQHDVRSIRQNMSQDRALMVEQSAQKAYGSNDYQSFNPNLTGMPAQNRQMSMSGSQLAAAGRLLLFRYLDFDVEPGNAYRYRVQLILKNPNYERSIVDLVDPASAAGETRKTPVSAPSSAIYVRDDTKFFLTKIKPANGRNDASATIDVFQWSAETGMTMYTEEKLKDLEAGQFVAAFTHVETKTRGRGANAKTTTTVKGGLELEVLRPANETFKVEPNVNFVTSDTLVDIASGYKLNPSDHADLNLQSDDSRRATATRPVSVASQAVIVDKFGNLAALDDSSLSKSEWAMAKARLNAERTPWSFLKEKNSEGGDEKSELDALAEQFGQGGEAGGKKKPPRRSRRANPLRRNGQSPSMQPGGLPNGYPGGGAGGAIPGS